MALLRHLAASLLAVGFASASCQLANAYDPSKPPVKAAQLCEPQGKGSYTFAMYTSETVVPTFDSSNEWAGLVQGQSFIIYDNTCAVKGVYGPQQSGSCGAPYVIEENFLPYVLTVKSVNFDVGGAYFAFTYANGKFTIGNNHCTCQSIGGGLQVNVGCKCAFPLEGETKRDVFAVEFDA